MVLAAGVFFWIAAQSGGFDREVISEAPKSLAYRLQYWAGAWDVVKEHPWLGTGPGNFRQHYLQYKLPESSEEIADPHNWIFDLWTSGGLLALLGSFLLLGWAVRQVRRERTVDASAENGLSFSAWEAGAAAAFFLVMLVRWVSGDFVGLRLVGLLLAGVIVWAILRKTPLAKVPREAMFAGIAALMVHLLGAGGMEMPAITQTALILLVFLDWGPWESDAKHSLLIQRAPKRILCDRGRRRCLRFFCAWSRPRGRCGIGICIF